MNAFAETSRSARFVIVFGLVMVGWTILDLAIGHSPARDLVPMTCAALFLGWFLSRAGEGVKK